MTAIAVTIAGSDSGGGAGIQADLKTFSALGVYGASVITALTAQNTKGVTGIHDVPPDFIAAQIDAVFSDLAVDAVKIGMLSQVSTIEAVAAGLDRHRARQCGARSGDGRDLRRPAAQSRRGRCAAQAADPARRGRSRRTCRRPRRCSTPASPTDEAAMRAQAERLLALGAKAVLIKGGHGGGAESVDLLVERAAASRGSPRRASRPRTPTAPAARCRRRSPPASPRAWRSSRPCARRRTTSPARSPPRAS